MDDPLFDRVAGLALRAAATERAYRRARTGPSETGQPCGTETASGAEGGAGAGSGGSA
ncbi:hypothetical protein [Streptomyces sp. NPDC017095]|uniref:hypothetical protein n=1 Tax=Streptomyces sp. NPDC017095 TaxID=3364977 RepID=UPI0037A19267